MPDDPALKVLSLRPVNTSTDTRSPRSWPGRLAEEDGIGLQNLLSKERAERAAERTAGLVLVYLDPAVIGLTEFANRIELSLSSTDNEFRRFKESIRLKGQDTPVGVRPAPEGSKHAYELVEGHRRHAAISQLNNEVEGGFKILARVNANASDAKELVLKMYRENAERLELSAIETGRMFAQWMEAGVYKTQREIAAVTGLNEVTISQYLTIAALPPEVLDAFADVRQIPMRWSVGLARACKEYTSETLARARRISKQTPRPDPESVYKALTAGAPAKKQGRKSSKLSESVKVDNKVLFTVSLKDGRLAIAPKQVADEDLPVLYEDLKSWVHKWMSGHRQPKK